MKSVVRSFEERRLYPATDLTPRQKLIYTEPPRALLDSEIFILDPTTEPTKDLSLYSLGFRG